MRFFPSPLAVTFLTLALTGSLALAGSVAQDPDADYDRLDGHGKSGKRVDVIEWENNLEIHVYPKGSLKGLALKLDKKNKDKPVMVIGYRFDNAPQTQLIRRAILGIPINESFKVFRDPSEDEFDKIIISNQGLSNQVVAFKLDPEPTQLYPEGHPANQVAQDDKKAAARKPAAKEEQEEEDRGPDEDGTIKPFFMERERRGTRR